MSAHQSPAIAALPTDQRDALLLAPYAMHSANSAGRRHPEAEHAYRGPYQRDRDRIVHSAAFRRLAYKTQVFTGERGDYHRTRLTHTLEVASIARTLSRSLGLNEDLTEALALAHDLGHPPFGHAGEEVLNDCLRNQGGFNHNAQALRIVEHLEVRYYEFRGLNLSCEVLEGQAHRANKDRPGGDSPLLEVQVVDAADSLAYSAHDADDALELGLLTFAELRGVPLWSAAVDQASRQAPQLSGAHLRRAVVRQLIDQQVGDLLKSTRDRLIQQHITSVADVRSSAHLVAPSPQVHEQKAGLQGFLFDRVYRHPQVLGERESAQLALGELFGVLCESPERVGVVAGETNPTAIARVVADHLASLTDRSAWEEYHQLLGK